MSAAASAANGIETATALLKSELGQLEEQQADLYAQQKSLQAQLAVVSGHIESLRGALAALQAVSRPADGEPESPRPPAGGRGGRTTADAPATKAGSTPPELQGRRFTEQVIAILTRDPDAVLRARDIAEALGRDESAGSINAVRSTLDRLVATSRAHRVGRGRYQAPPVGRD
ncbi:MULTISPECIES: hypothetical protein [unclassified Streptomyces]|uniref:hypothetical protein n=1 Tax=unclassified Streptomyces TaxID=2593676 RepID=UPI0011CE861C|nr:MULTISPECIES: hypothetical protein [unclassified Streptomyces]TXS58065.1 hypothetical protein EAO69_42715 [Streptomyces sp. me109]